MSDDSVTSFSVDDVTIAQNEMRHILGLPEPRFSFPTFIGMLSDEIEQMRRAGHTNEPALFMPTGSLPHILRSNTRVSLL